MIDIKVKDSDIRKAVEEGMDSSGSDGWRLCPVDIQWLWCLYL